MPYRGWIEDVAFACHEIGQFCMAWAIDDLAEEMAMEMQGRRHILCRREDVLVEIEALRTEGFHMILAKHEADDELARQAGYLLACRRRGES